MKDLTKYFIDLSKLSGEQVRMLNKVTNGYVNQISEFPLLFWDETEWNQTQKGDKLNTKGKTELAYPEFIKLFEGGEGENKGWIKIESEADLPKENGDYFVFTKEKVVRVEMFSINSKLDNDYYKKEVTHYQPIIKPEPPKF